MAIAQRKPQSDFEQEIFAVFKDEYTVVGEYTGINKKIEVRHNLCKKVYKVRALHLRNGVGCPYCQKSKGEKAISNFLNENGIIYTPQYTFNDLLGKKKKKLRFDFYIPLHRMLIEYQGLQHYQPCEFFGGEAQLKKQIEYDKRKADYAFEHSYDLTCIPYTEFNNINEILSAKLLKSVKVVV